MKKGKIYEYHSSEEEEDNNETSDDDQKLEQNVINDNNVVESEDEEEEEDDIPDDAVILGFVEPLTCNLSEEMDDIQGKVGGKPLWLDTLHLPSNELLKCGSCEKPLVLLLQINAPLPEIEESAFHRTIYVFCCRDGKCHKQEDWKSKFVVLRSQLPEKNQFFTKSKPKEKSKQDEMKWVRSNDEKLRSLTCEICGQFASKRCASCKKLYYCGREHQLLDWNLGHEKECKILQQQQQQSQQQQPQQPQQQNIQKKKSNLCFAEFELVTEPEDEEKARKSSNNLNDEEILSKTLVTADNDDQDPDFGGDDEKFEQIDKDKAFLKFQKKTEQYPDQILRYYNDKSRNKTVWISEKGLPTEGIPPKCPHCNSIRLLEFQVKISIDL